MKTTAMISTKIRRRGYASSLWCLAIAILLLTILQPIRAKHAWEGPGCHRIGHTRRISIPGCVEFDITTNACRGYCESYSVPSTQEILRINSQHIVTSYGQCCNMIETEDVKVSVACFEGQRNLLFKSALTCSCYHCKKN
ncbi:Guanine nucleotide-binding protein alpha-2 subunit [Chamberlinius hualienensis]